MYITAIKFTLKNLDTIIDKFPQLEHRWTEKQITEFTSTDHYFVTQASAKAVDWFRVMPKYRFEEVYDVVAYDGFDDRFTLIS